MSLATLARRLAAPLENLADPYAPAHAPPQPGVWFYLKGNLKPLRKVIAASLIFTVLAATVEVWLVTYAGTLIDTLSTVGLGEDLWDLHGTKLGLAALAILILRPITHYLREGTNDLGLRPNAATLFRWRAARHVGRQSVGWFQSDLSGRTAARVVEIGSDAAGAIYSSLNAIAYVSVYLIGILILMAAADARLLAIVAAWLGLYAATMRALIPAFDRVNEAFHASRSALTGELVDAYANIDTVRLFADADAQEADTREKVEDVRQAFLHLQRVEVALNMTITALDGIILVGLVGFAAALWNAGAATLGIVGVALALAFRITGMIEWAMEAVAAIFSHVGALREALRTVAQPLAIEDAPGAPALAITEGRIGIEAVCHHYSKGTGGLDGVTLEVAPGEKVGLVGRSGAGKSTLVNLILRFFEAEAGRIRIDGQDIAEVTQDSLRAGIGMVAQEAALLHRSVRANIAFGQGQVRQAEIEAAARKAHAHDFIQDLRDEDGRTGYAARVGERGVKLSGGQRQRIALARVILKDAPILILDEATSALDSEIETAIQETLYEVMEGKTVIAIAHRLSTIARLDRIIVLDAGRIAEEGTHAELLAAGGLYAGFWNRQSGGFLGKEPGG